MGRTHPPVWPSVKPGERRWPLRLLMPALCAFEINICSHGIPLMLKTYYVWDCSVMSAAAAGIWGGWIHVVGSVSRTASADGRGTAPGPSCRAGMGDIRRRTWESSRQVGGTAGSPGCGGGGRMCPGGVAVASGGRCWCRSNGAASGSWPGWWHGRGVAQRGDRPGLGPAMVA